MSAEQHKGRLKRLHQGRILALDPVALFKYVLSRSVAGHNGEASTRKH